MEVNGELRGDWMMLRGIKVWGRKDIDSMQDGMEGKGREGGRGEKLVDYIGKEDREDGGHLMERREG